MPVQLLLQMIRLSDDTLAEFFSRYVTSALDLYLQAKRGVQSLTAYNPLVASANGRRKAMRMARRNNAVPNLRAGLGT